MAAAEARDLRHGKISHLNVLTHPRYTVKVRKHLYGGKGKKLLQALVENFEKDGWVFVDLLCRETSLFHLVGYGRIVLEFFLYLFQQLLLGIFSLLALIFLLSNKFQ